MIVEELKIVYRQPSIINRVIHAFINSVKELYIHYLGEQGGTLGHES